MPSMKLFILLIFSLFYMITCSDSDNPVVPTTFTTDTLQVPFNKSVLFNNNTYSITFDSVRLDYRRPLQDQQYNTYIWEWENGWAEIELAVSGIDGKLRLPIDAAPPDSVGETTPGKPVKVSGLSFRLLDLSPLRTESDQIIPDSEYVATIIVERDTSTQIVPSSFFPLKTSNSWSYSDTNWNNDLVVRTQEYDIEVQEPFHDILGSWWQLSKGTEFLYSIDKSIMASGNMISLRQSGYMFRQYGGIFSYPMPFYKDSGPTIDTIFTIMEGDLLYERFVRLIVDTSIVVPAGEFTTVYEYSGYWNFYKDCKIYLAPNVGVIYVEGSSPMYRYKAVLNDYTIQN